MSEETRRFLNFAVGFFLAWIIFVNRAPPMPEQILDIQIPQCYQDYSLALLALSSYEK